MVRVVAERGCEGFDGDGDDDEDGDEEEEELGLTGRAAVAVPRSVSSLLVDEEDDTFTALPLSEAVAVEDGPGASTLGGVVYAVSLDVVGFVLILARSVSSA